MSVIIDGVRYVKAPDPCENPELLDAIGSFEDAGGDMTIREYLGALLTELWRQGEGFNGKRPFGNSGWKSDIYAVLIREGAVEGTLDEDGCIDEFSNESRRNANAIVYRLIEQMGRP